MVTRPELAGTFGMVTSTHWMASAAGLAVLEQGGNAFDAAVAAGFVLQVVEPHMNGPGGEAPIIGYQAQGAGAFVVNGQGVAPARATIEEFESLSLSLIPGSGLLPACVPGAFDAWMVLLRDFGTLPLRAVLKYAIGYAHAGFPVTPAVIEAINEVEDLFRDEWKDSARVYLSEGRVPRAGSLLKNPNLAATYAHVVRKAERHSEARDQQIEAARAVFYRGFVARRIAEYVEQEEVLDSTGRKHRGLLGYEDLGTFEARVEEPVSFDYSGLAVCKTGPWGQGPVFLQQLALLKGFDIAAMEPGSAELIHTVTECSKLAFADREAWYGDPDFDEVPLDDLLSPEYSRERCGLVGESASMELRPGRPGGRAARLPPPVTPDMMSASAPGVGEPARAVARARAISAERAGDTCHLDVVDRFGNVVSATPSGGWLQGSPVIAGLGFCLGTRAQMFWLTRGLPNSLQPGKRPRTTLSPSLAFRDSGPFVAFGTPGGDQQDQWPLHFFLNHAVFGMSLQEAIDAPQWHHEHFPSSFYPRASHPGALVLEGRHGESVVAELRAGGHDVHVVEDWALGSVTAAARAADKSLRAAADSRGSQAYAMGR